MLSNDFRKNRKLVRKIMHYRLRFASLSAVWKLFVQRFWIVKNHITYILDYMITCIGELRTTARDCVNDMCPSRALCAAYRASSFAYLHKCIHLYFSLSSFATTSWPLRWYAFARTHTHTHTFSNALVPQIFTQNVVCIVEIMPNSFHVCTSRDLRGTTEAKPWGSSLLLSLETRGALVDVASAMFTCRAK